MIRKNKNGNAKNVRNALVILTAFAVVYSLYGCGSPDGETQSGGAANTAAEQSSAAQTDVQETDDTQADAETNTTESMSAASNTQSGEDLDIVPPDDNDDEWYKKEIIYTDDNGRRLEVMFCDDGMLEFAVDGLSLYYTTVDNFQQENSWKVYTCDDGTSIIFYPGTPAHLEISDGDYAGLYEAGM